MRLENSLQKSFSCSGIGLHSGRQVTAVLHPAGVGEGICFVRGDGPPVRAHVSQVQATVLATTLGQGAARVSTVEHLMAALSCAGIDNARVLVDGPELPILDGSALPWADAIRAAGRRELARPCAHLVIHEPLELGIGASFARISPARGLEIRVRVDFPHPLLHDQEIGLLVSQESFERELAWARTFGFVWEVEAMRARGLGLGGSLDNALIFDATGVVNPGGQRGPDEAVRHKALDVLGDLALLGWPLQGRLDVVRPGHGFMAAVLREILDHPSCWHLG